MPILDAIAVHPLLLAASPGEAPAEWSIGNVWAMFAIVVSLLAFFVLVVFMLMMGRRRRRRLAARREDDGAPVDAWAEAGRRVQAYPSRRSDD